MRTILSGAVAGLLLLAATTSFAEPSADDRTVARSLFDQGRALVKDGNYAAACPKLEESQKIDSGVGTLFNLADCYEHLGRFASAWAAARPLMPPPTTMTAPTLFCAGLPFFPLSLIVASSRGLEVPVIASELIS